MDPLKMAVTGAAQAVERVEAAISAAPMHVKAMAGRELSALSAALRAITVAQSEIVRAIEGVQGGK